MNNSTLLGQIAGWTKVFITPAILGISAILVSEVHGQLTIDVGDHSLQPNTPDQIVELFVENTGNTAVDVGGLVFNVQVANGQDATSAPEITGVDIKTGTTFGSVGANQQVVSSFPHFWNVNFTVPPSPGTVSLGAHSSTRIAQVTVDTTGFSSVDSWAFNLQNTRNLATHYLDGDGGNILVSINDGTLSVVPEPNSAFVAAGVLLGIAGIRRWQLRRG